MDRISKTSGRNIGTAPLPAARLVSLPDGQAHLVLGTPVTIGRAPSCTISVEGDDVSRSQAYVLRTPQGYLLVDSSLHGTYVSGARVQAQRVLAEGDIVEIGGRAFRFDLDRSGLESDDRAQPGELPMTSQHRLRRPGGVWSTGKVGLAVALGEQVQPGSRLKVWIRRYGLSEIAGIAAAFCGSWLPIGATDSRGAAAYGGSIGEALGFYGPLVAREMIQDAYAAA